MRTMRSSILLIWSLSALVVSCRTTTDEASPLVATAQASEGPPADLSMAECPPKSVVCGQEDEPAYCTATTHAGRPLPESLVVRAWGSNSCQGRVGLARTACAQGLDPAQLGQVQCVPDASGGHCPPNSVACGPEVSPTICVAARYGAQWLSEDQALQAWGTNPCWAREALAAEACRRNLDPTALGDVACRPDPQGAECPPPEAPCDDVRRAATCAVTKVLGGRAPPEPLEAQGDGTCEARQRLMRLVCSRGLKPGDIEDIVCKVGD